MFARGAPPPRREWSCRATARRSWGKLRPPPSRGWEVERRAGNHGRACRVCGTEAPRRSPLFNSGEAMGRAADWSVRVCKLPDWSGGVWTPAARKPAFQKAGKCGNDTFQNAGKWQAVAILGHATAARPESRVRRG